MFQEVACEIECTKLCKLSQLADPGNSLACCFDLKYFISHCLKAHLDRKCHTNDAHDSTLGQF